MIQIPEVLSSVTKKRLCKFSPEEVTAIVTAAIEDVDHGSLKPLDELIRNRI